MWIRIAQHAQTVALVGAAVLLLSGPGSAAAWEAEEVSSRSPRWATVADSLPRGTALDSTRLSAAVDELFRRWHRPDSPGAAVLVLHGGEVAHSRGYGMANLEHGIPMRPSTVLDIASISKQLGAMAVAILEAEGGLHLDDPVREYLPELPEWGDQVTIRHLVHHTSGVRDWPGTLGMGGWDFQDVISFQQILRMAQHQGELNFPPGSDYAYSNTGYNLMAEVVARVTGMSFREWSDERIFRPLGMTRTHVHDDHTEIILDRAESYAPRPEGGYRRITNNLTALASSSVHTTVEDLARWVGNFRDPVVGGPAVVERMHERGVLTGGDTISYAFGQVVGAYRGARRVTHTGSWAGYRSALHRFPELDFAVVILANTADMNPAGLAEEITDLYLGDALDPFPVAAAGPSAAGGGEQGGEAPWNPSAEELAAYEGTYRSGELDSTYRLRVDAGVLTGHHFRTGTRTLIPSATDRFQAAGLGEVRFLRDEEGEITGFTANSDRVRNLRFVRIP
jgi:CubicO group peptidase (beta-lactamase class C family)